MTWKLPDWIGSDAALSVIALVMVIHLFMYLYVTLGAVILMIQLHSRGRLIVHWDVITVKLSVITLSLTCSLVLTMGLIYVVTIFFARWLLKL